MRWLLTLLLFANAAAAYVEPPALAEQVKAGRLPPVDKRLPQKPLVVTLGEAGTSIGKYGGTLNTLGGRSRDTRLFTIYGYARLVGYDRHLSIVPDILESLEVQEGRIFTLHLRKGHRWSDGHPFTADDFRYYWEDVANNRELSPSGPPRDLLVDGEPPKFEVLDESTVRYTWSKPNPRAHGASCCGWASRGFRAAAPATWSLTPPTSAGSSARPTSRPRSCATSASSASPRTCAEPRSEPTARSRLPDCAR